MLDCADQSQTSSSSVIWKYGKSAGSYRPSPTIQSVMPTLAPVPADTMRSGKASDAPGVVTRTGRIELTPLPGRSQWFA